MRVRPRCSSPLIATSGTNTPRVMVGLTLTMSTRPTSAKTDHASKSLHGMRKIAVSSTSSLKRDNASPDECGSATAAGSWNSRRSMLCCRSAALVYMNGALVSWQPTRNVTRPTVDSVSSASTHQKGSRCWRSVPNQSKNVRDSNPGTVSSTITSTIEARFGPHSQGRNAIILEK